MFAWFTALLMLIAIFVMLIMMISVRMSFSFNKAKLNVLHCNRGEMSKAEFIDFFLKKGFSHQGVVYLYDEIQKNLTQKSYSLHPEDNLYRDYFLHRDYLREVAIRTFRVANQRSPNIVEEKLLSVKGSTDTFEKILTFTSLQRV